MMSCWQVGKFVLRRVYVLCNTNNNSFESIGKSYKTLSISWFLRCDVSSTRGNASADA